MTSPLHAFMSELCGATPSVKIVEDNAVAPVHSSTWSQARQDARHAWPSKPTRPHRIAAKGISYIASVLPPELDPVLAKPPSKVPPLAAVAVRTDSIFCSEMTLAYEGHQDEIKPSSKGSRRLPRTTLAKNQAQHEKRASKRVTTAYAA